MGKKQPSQPEGKFDQNLAAWEGAPGLLDLGQGLVLEKRGFSSGSSGYGFYGKVTIGGVKFQASVSLVALGTKPQA